MKNRKGLVSVALAATIFAAGTSFVRQIEAPGEIIYPLEAFFGALVVTLALVIQGRSARMLVKWGPALIWLLFSGAMITANNTCYILAVQKTTMAEATMSHYLGPVILSVLAGPIILGTKPTKRGLIAILMGFVGLLTILSDRFGSGFHFNAGLWFGLASAFFFALGLAATKILDRYKIDPLVTVVYQNLTTVVLMTPWIYQFTSGAVKIDSTSLTLIGLVGTVVLGLGFLLLNRGAMDPSVKPTELGTILYSEPVGAIYVASLIYAEPLTAPVLLGSIAIIMAGYLTFHEAPAQS
ncbi:MAG: DMT family transporter [bacterium]